jgi:hypothetical protein
MRSLRILVVILALALLVVISGCATKVDVREQTYSGDVFSPCNPAQGANPCQGEP